MNKYSSIEVLGSQISIIRFNEEDFINISDIAKYKNPDFANDVIRNRLRNKNTLEFLGLREKLYNMEFKPVEFDGFRNQAGLNSFVISPQKWIEKTNAKGLIVKAGRYGGGTFAHKDIALEFASRVSVEVKIYIIKEFQRLKEIEQKNLDRTVKRLVSKMNYKIHTDAIQEYLIPEKISKSQASYVYADEADVLNVALFGMTAKQRREKTRELKGNIRDYATIEQLVVLANMESMNAELIRIGVTQSKRVILLNNSAIQQMKSLVDEGDKKYIQSLLEDSKI